MEVVTAILCVIVYVVATLFICVPCAVWWAQIFKMRKLKKSFNDSGGFNLDELKKHIK